MLALLAAEGPNGRFLPADIKEFWWSTAAFVVVFSLLIWKLLPLVKKAMSGRSDRIREEIVDAERAKVEAESELSSLRSKLGDADAEAARIRAEAETTAETVKADLIARAEAEATDAKSKASIEVSASAGQAASDLQAAIAEQAADAAESVVAANLDQATHADLIDRYIEEVSGS
jgi:F-type H+-transporting ATPase subunit b